MIVSSISSRVLAYILYPALSLEEEVDQMAENQALQINSVTLVHLVYCLDKILFMLHRCLLEFRGKNCVWWKGMQLLCLKIFCQLP